jgi:hypothetical protein
MKKLITPPQWLVYPKNRDVVFTFFFMQEITC